MDRIYDLQCEYQENPIQIDIKRPRFSWKIEADGQNVLQSSFKLTVMEQKNRHVVWETSESSRRTVSIEYAGEPLKENCRYSWEVSSVLEDGRVLDSADQAYIETGIWEEEPWAGIWIGKKDRKALGNCPCFRKRLELTETCVRAKLFISARGLYEVSINGRVMDEYVLAPGWTNYGHHLQYLSYDVTDELQVGDNVIGVRLGDGWYSGEISFNHQTQVYGEQISFAAILIMEQEDGSRRLVTDTTWKTSESGIVSSAIYDGEYYDMTKEAPDWNCPGFDDSSWIPADIMEDTESAMTAMANEGTKRIEIVKPVGVIYAPNGETLIDMGQNMTGWVRITVDEADKGDTVHIKHAEILDQEGNFYSGNIRLAKQEDRYILRQGNQVLEPHFTYHGFRYIKVLEFPREIKAEYFEGIVVHTAMKPAIQFHCSDEMVNQLHHNLIWGQKGNFLDVPTDCPQRDERLGWTGDAQIFCRTACYNFEADCFFAKWLEDVKADQYANGAIPFVVPDVLPKDWCFLTEADIGPEHTSAAWGDAITICPWMLYLNYGDVRILERTYDNMKRYLDYICQGAAHGSGNPSLWDWGPQLGDWLALDNEDGSYRGATDENYISTAYYAFSTGIVCKCAEILGRNEDAVIYGQRYQNIKTAFKNRYMKDKKIIIATQTAQIVPLFFGLLEGEEECIAVRKLLDLLRDNGNHLTTGFVGTPYLCHVLSQYGHSYEAYTLLLQKDFPSWLYQVTQGATTIWEHWDGKKPDGSFWSDNMNSFNHYAYGSIGEWLYRCAAGIDADEKNPGFSHIIIRPQSDERLPRLSCAYESVHGQIKSSWERRKGNIRYWIEIPANTTATIYLENGEIHEVGSGKYEYAV